MAFKNIKIPKEIIKEYEVDGEIIEPWFCTIDEEKILYCLTMEQYMKSQMRYTLH